MTRFTSDAGLLSRKIHTEPTKPTELPEPLLMKNPSLTKLGVARSRKHDHGHTRKIRSFSSHLGHYTYTAGHAEIVHMQAELAIAVALHDARNLQEVRLLKNCKWALIFPVGPRVCPRGRCESFRESWIIRISLTVDVQWRDANLRELWTASWYCGPSLFKAKVAFYGGEEALHSAIMSRLVGWDVTTATNIGEANVLFVCGHLPQLTHCAHNAIIVDLFGYVSRLYPIQ